MHFWFCINFHVENENIFALIFFYENFASDKMIICLVKNIFNIFVMKIHVKIEIMFGYKIFNYIIFKLYVNDNGKS